jgi:hypothetical protein
MGMDSGAFSRAGCGKVSGIRGVTMVGVSVLALSHENWEPCSGDGLRRDVESMSGARTDVELVDDVGCHYPRRQIRTLVFLVVVAPSCPRWQYLSMYSASCRLSVPSAFRFLSICVCMKTGKEIFGELEPSMRDGGGGRT